MVFIPYATTYTTTMRGRIPKLVKCERCPLEYVYLAERSASGSGTSMLFLDNAGAQGRSRGQAEEELLAALDRACDPVPCPGCGHIQEHMVPRARQLRHRWMGRAGLYLAPVAAILVLPAMIAMAKYQELASDDGLVAVIIAWLLVAAVGGTAILLPTWRYFSNRHYDPNSADVETRKERGRALAVTRTEFEQQQPRPEHADG